MKNKTDSQDILKDRLVELYRVMLKIRKVQIKIEEEYPKDEMKTPVHLCFGQEAIPAGVCGNLHEDDYVFSNHRGHGHYIAKGGNLNAMIAELYCKETGCSRGRGGSMHLIDLSVGLMGSSSIVSGGIPLATGAALSAWLKKDNKVSVVFFGDAASEEGVLYESMNFAMLKKLPVVFVCENNFYSVCSHISSRQANDDVSMRTKAFSLPYHQVDGADVSDVYLKSRDAINYARSGKGPFFLECKVYRWRGHAGAGDDLKLKYRKMDEWEKWIKRDPVLEFEEKLNKEKIINDDLRKSIGAALDKEIEAAFKFAKESPLPDKKEIMKYLFADKEIKNALD
ncbi:MAG: thiamine pyrophosphate-dependent dehydrogenase E1 component subunit alpha [Candidatus Omnitrophica bacterium]|nr:thiamine pyrophosphate-dependent dehydrogenase E1 component subunit alpha [Candidatus Omnitrophota bacterium]